MREYSPLDITRWWLLAQFDKATERCYYCYETGFAVDSLCEEHKTIYDTLISAGFDLRSHFE